MLSRFDTEEMNAADSLYFRALLAGTFFIFLYAKLTGEIAWSWWWVTAPVWGPFALILGAFLGGLVPAICRDVTSLVRQWRRARREEGEEDV